MDEKRRQELNRRKEEELQFRAVDIRNFLAEGIPLLVKQCQSQLRLIERQIDMLYEKREPEEPKELPKWTLTTCTCPNNVQNGYCEHVHAVKDYWRKVFESGVLNYHGCVAYQSAMFELGEEV